MTDDLKKLVDLCQRPGGPGWPVNGEERMTHHPALGLMWQRESFGARGVNKYEALAVLASHVRLWLESKGLEYELSSNYESGLDDDLDYLDSLIYTADTAIRDAEAEAIKAKERT